MRFSVSSVRKSLRRFVGLMGVPQCPILSARPALEPLEDRTLLSGFAGDAADIDPFASSAAIISAAASDSPGRGSVIAEGSVFFGIAVTGTNISALEGIAFTKSVAMVVDSDPELSASDLSATINWGDGSSPTSGLVSQNGDGSFDVSGTHTYGSDGVYTFTVFVDNNSNERSGSGSAQATVDESIVISPESPTAIEDVLTNLLVATFTDFAPGTVAGDYSAVIDWGDGASVGTIGTVTANADGGFDVRGSHLFPSPGTYFGAVTVYEGGRSATASFQVQVFSATIDVTAQDFAGTAGTANINQFVGSFDDFGEASDFSATIDWGDGTSPTAGTISSGEGFSVRGTHTYASAGSYTVTLTVLHPATSRTGSDTATAFIAGPLVQFSLAGVPVTTAAGVNRTVRVATINDSKAGTTAGNFTALINWGDGTAPSAGTVVATTAGRFDVFGAHTYANAGNFTITINVANSDGRTGTATAPATVLAESLTAVGLNFQATPNVPRNNSPVAFVFDALSGTTASDLSAVIDWGDGTPTSSGVVQPNGNGSFTILGSHTYTGIGSFPVSITVSHTDGRIAVGSALASVAFAPLVLVGRSFTAIEDVAGTFTVANLFDGNPASVPADYTITINWGDGTASTAGSAVPNAGSFDIVGSHTYADPGVYAVLVQVMHFDGRTASATAAGTVLSGAISASGINFTAIEDVPRNNVAVAMFNVADTSALPGAFAASIDWGDGSAPSAGVITLVSPGSFIVRGSHTYPDDGIFPVSITISSALSSAVASATATVSDNALIADGIDISANAGIPFNGPVANFSDVVPSSVAGDFSALINWGDGKPASAGTITFAGGNGVVHGSHTYDVGGSFTITVQVLHTDGRSATTTSLATVAPGALSAIGQNFAVFADDPFTAQVAIVTDLQPGTTDGDFNALINWGDGSSPSVGLAVQLSGTTFGIRGSHTYANPGPFAVSVSIVHDDGRTTTASATATVTLATLSATGQSFSETAGAPFTRVVATIDDEKSSTVAGDFTASIDWGDGSAPTFGTIVAIGGGLFDVRGSHTYTTDGVFDISVSITHADGRSTSASSTITAAFGPLVGIGLGVNATAGEALIDVPLARITDPRIDSTAGDFTAIINWGGESSPTPGSISVDAFGAFVVSGSHLYDGAGIFLITVDVTHSDGRTVTVSTPAQVSELALPATAVNVVAIEGIKARLVRVATFSPKLDGLTPSDFASLISWGDGRLSSGVITQNAAGLFIVRGTHLYRRNGRFDVTVHIDSRSTRAITRSTARVINAARIALPQPLSFTAGTPFRGLVFAFTDANRFATADDYDARINWGDGEANDGLIKKVGRNRFNIFAEHEYQRAGRFTITFRALDQSGNAFVYRQRIVVG